MPSQVKAPFLLLILRVNRMSAIRTNVYVIGKFPLTLFTLLHIGSPSSDTDITGNT
jgi:hypothetical protein